MKRTMSSYRRMIAESKRMQLQNIDTPEMVSSRTVRRAVDSWNKRNANKTHMRHVRR